jgi:hypothetical protein
MDPCRGAVSPPRHESPVPGYDQAVSIRDNFRDFFHGAAYGAYERELRLQAAELNDLFLLLCYMEIVGLPNPATLYLLDVYPYILDQFHTWHRRMGMDRSPLGNLPCC